MLVHQIFDTMLAFATRVLNGEMENSEAMTEWTFEQIYSFVVPNVRAEVLEEEDKKRSDMNRSLKKIWNVISSILVALVVILALLLVGARVVGLQVFTVLSGSMEPTYHTGSLIYVKEVDPYTIEVGKPITFMLNEDTVVTHRVVGIVPDEEDPTVIRFRTKGDANEAEDGGLVHYKNVIGTPIFSIPYLGYVAEYIQHPPGMYIAISAGAILLLLVFIPDIFADDKDKEQDKKKKSSRRNKGAHVAAHEAAAVDAATEEPASESLADEIRRKTDNLLTDEEVEDIRREVEAGRFDDAAADALRQELLRREAKRDVQEVSH